MTPEADAFVLSSVHAPHSVVRHPACNTSPGCPSTTTSGSRREPTRTSRSRRLCCASARSPRRRRSSPSAGTACSMQANARVIELSGLPFTVHGPFLHFEFGSRSERQHRAALEVHRRHLAVAARARRARVRRPPRPAAQVQRAGTRAWSRRSRTSFEELAALQEEYGVIIAVENLPFVRHTHFRAPGDLDLRGLGLSLDVGHAAVTGHARRVAQRRPLRRSSTCTCTTTRGTWAATSTSRSGAASSTPRRSWSWPAPPAPPSCSSTRTRPT